MLDLDLVVPTKAPMGDPAHRVISFANCESFSPHTLSIYGCWHRFAYEMPASDESLFHEMIATSSLRIYLFSLLAFNLARLQITSKVCGWEKIVSGCRELIASHPAALLQRHQSLRLLCGTS